MSYAKAKKLSFTKKEIDNFLTTPKSYEFMSDRPSYMLGAYYRFFCNHNGYEIDSFEGVSSFIFALKNNFEKEHNLPNADYSLSVNKVVGFRSNPSKDRTTWIDDLLFNFKEWYSWGVSRQTLIETVMKFNMLNLETYHTSHLNQLNFNQL